MKKKVGNEILEWVLCFVVAYVIYLIINYFIGTISGIKQTSMYPTAKEGEKVVISRRVLWNKTLKRGDIVTIEAPIGMGENGQALYKDYKGLDWFVYHIMEIGKRSYIKRIVALEGEHLYISEEGEIFINDEKLTEAYLTETTTPRSGPIYDLVIPDGCVFVMGDNRSASKDSREFGAIPLSKVEAKVGIRVLPLSKIGAI